MPSEWPGTVPFRRGSSATGQRSGWDLRSIHEHPSAIAARDEILEDLRGGVTSIELRLADGHRTTGLRFAGASEPATDREVPLDDELAEVIGRALEGVDLEIAPIALDAGARVREAAGALLSLWDRRGLAPDR
jgi:methylmalonyl-CoA mutase